MVIFQPKNKQAMVALVDANNFYVSCERLFRPDLRGVPVVVLSNNDGCIVSRSDEVKAMGVEMAVPYHELRPELDKRGVVAFSSNYALYADLSNRMQAELRQFSPEIEVYSIDECFLDLSGFAPETLPDYCARIREVIGRNLGLPVSVGVGATKTLAKIASRIAKKHLKLNGVCVISTEKQRIWALQHTPIGSVWGIGRNYSKQLMGLRVQTAFDFGQLPEAVVRRHMKVMGLRTQAELLGTPCLALTDVVPPKKAIATTRSFAKPVTELKFLQEAVSTFATRCAEKMRRQHSAAQFITVFATSNRLQYDAPYTRGSYTIALPQASNHTLVVVKYALAALDRCFQEGVKYKKAGVLVSQLVPEGEIQPSLFETQAFWNKPELCRTIDALNLKYGRDFVKPAILGDGKQWAMRQEKLSPQYTTKVSDLLRVNLKGIKE